MRGRKKNPGLSERELEVLRLVAVGKSYREVAFELNLADKTTIDAHAYNIRKKTGARDRLARWRWSNGARWALAPKLWEWAA